jgi:hypothetical protein
MSNYLLDELRSAYPSSLYELSQDQDEQQQSSLHEAFQRDQDEALVWSRRFHHILDHYYVLRGTLPQLFEEFVTVALQVGKAILSERMLDYEAKTVKPIKNLGFAGGEKFLSKGILYVIPLPSINSKQNKSYS